MIALPQMRGFMSGAAAAGPATDPLFAYVVALLHLDSNVGSTVVNNAGSGPAFTMPTGAVISTSQYVFGGHSCRFVGSNGRAVAGATSTAYQAGTGDFCIEGRTRMDSASVQNLCDFRNTGAQVAPAIYLNTDRTIHYYVNGTECIVSATNAWAPLTWFAWCVERAGATTRLMVDGTVVGSFSDSYNYNVSSSCCFIGAFNDANLSGADGYIDEVRVTIGASRYGGSYTPAIAPFPDA